jgi:hypothetical protein
MTPIDALVVAHYYIWLAFTAIEEPFEELRFKATKRYLNARGFRTAL